MRFIFLIILITALFECIGCKNKNNINNNLIIDEKNKYTPNDKSSLSATYIVNLGNNISMEFVLINPGSFTMGANESQESLENYIKGKYPDWPQTHEFTNEYPPRDVKITKSYYIGKYEVTQEQYEIITGINPAKEHLKIYPNTQLEIGDKYPAICVSWDDANEFCKMVTKNTGFKIQLPTEAQWEYACRANSLSRFYFGNDIEILCDYEWYLDNSNYTLHIIGQKKPNEWGLYDMLGNADEWCLDFYSKYNSETLSDPAGPKSGDEHSIRGGSWFTHPWDCRSSSRGSLVSDGKNNALGFRVVLLK